MSTIVISDANTQKSPDPVILSFPNRKRNTATVSVRRSQKLNRASAFLGGLLTGRAVPVVTIYQLARMAGHGLVVVEGAASTLGVTRIKVDGQGYWKLPPVQAPSLLAA